jgi:hypothetical protein
VQTRRRAVVPLGPVPGEPDATMVSDLDLAGLMDKLDQLAPPAGSLRPQDERAASPTRRRAFN